MPTIEEELRQGWRLHQSGDIASAEKIYRGVLARYPVDANAWVYLGIAQFDQRLFGESVQSYQRALALEDDFPIAWNNLGNSFRMLGEVEEAERCLDKALQQQPGYLSALKNRGTLWVWCGEIRRGLHWYREGLQVDPDNAELHRNLGVIHLLLGDYDVGWPEYRWRWRMPGMYRPKLSAPIWRGEDLRGKTILLYPEQGRGDAIQFVRSAAVLQGRGARVILECAREMVPLFSSAPGVDRLLAQGIAVSEPIDYQASLLEVVDVCYCQTGQIPYAEELFASGAGYLTVSEALIDYWCRWLGTSPSGRRVGINWQGNPGHHADVYRSVPLEVLRPLIEVGGIDWVNLQFGFGVEQLERCDFADSILRLPDHVDTTDGAFTDTAAIVKNLDLVITTDTAVAHLAAAVGTKVMMLLGKVPDWRWLMEGETTPWYPTITMLRQSQLGHWDDVVHQAVTRLTAGLENQ
ncbi:MAG: tetratricopeptide repeat-containing glycosyltransferase family protein [Pirellulales bacterium]|nr:tetratricopeptide repeat-containing glycosyltransferase family protein [Pirellulales bacterium]